MSDSVLKRGWPSGSCRLLLKAYACPPDQAIAAWHEWSKSRDFDDVDWAETRLLAAVAGRIQQLEPDSPLRSRLEGIRRFVWTRNQIRFNQSLPVVDLFNDAQIPVMVLKGGARLFTDPEAASARYVRDLDFLLPKDRVDEGSELLIANGYRPMTGKLPGRMRSVAFDRCYANSGANIEFAEIDIHRAVLRYGRSGNFDDNLWARGKEVEFRKRRVWVPSPADHFVITIAHGMVADLDHPADWVVDSLCAMRDPKFSWDAVIRETSRRSLMVPMAAGLTYLIEELKWPVPEQIRSEVAKRSKSWLFRKEFLSDIADRPNRGFSNRIHSFAAESRRSFGRWRLDRTRSTSYAASPVWGRASPKSVQLNTRPASVKLEKKVRVVVELELPAAPTKRRQFDLLIDNQWVGRLRIRPVKMLPSKGGTSWKFSLPNPTQGDVLKMVPIDENFLPYGRVPLAH